MTDSAVKPSLIIRQYNSLTPYEDRFLEMKALTEQRDENTPDELWILQHRDVLTQGQAQRFVLRAVRLGATVGDADIEVLAGLRAGDQIALQPVAAAQHGSQTKE